MAATKNLTWDDEQKIARAKYQERFDTIRAVDVKSEGLGELIPVVIMVAVPFLLACM